ncbi:MAG: hypothetical protein ACLUQ6_05840 [Alistipes onderdonkii]
MGIKQQFLKKKLDLSIMCNNPFEKYRRNRSTSDTPTFGGWSRIQVCVPQPLFPRQLPLRQTERRGETHCQVDPQRRHEQRRTGRWRRKHRRRTGRRRM